MGSRSRTEPSVALNRAVARIGAPAKLIWFGDGGSGTALWSDDNWWIKDVVDGAEDTQGFNRLLQDDYGCRRHEGKANYVFADGHTGRYNANDIRCDEGECWWSLRLDAHARRVAAALALVAVAFVSKQVGGCRKTREEGATTRFYDQSERRLYEVPRDTLPSHKGIGGPNGDGVRAVVMAFRSQQSDPSKWRIAYLETYTPELKDLLEKVQAARASGQAFKGRIPARDSEYFHTNSLVKGLAETEWHASSSPEDRRVLTEWRSWRGPDGQPPVVCVP